MSNTASGWVRSMTGTDSAANGSKGGSSVDCIQVWESGTSRTALKSSGMMRLSWIGLLLKDSETEFIML